MTTSLPAPQPKGSQKLQSVEYVWNLPSGIIPGALAATVLSLGAIAGSVYLRYGNFNLTQIPLNTETLSSSNLIGKQISFYRAPDSLYHIEFEISQNGQSTPILLSPVDLRLMIPQIPASIRENQTLTQWFLTEQEFNRQRVIFPAGSPEIHLRDRFMGYDPQDLSISLTNNCLGAGYWEVAIFAQTPDGQQKIYQGYFDFPKGAYARLVSEINNVSYWNHAPSIEPWPGFDFYSGMPFNLDSLRTVKRRYLIDAQDLNNENIFAINEQLSKAKLMVFNSRFFPSRFDSSRKDRSQSLVGMEEGIGYYLVATTAKFHAIRFIPGICFSHRSICSSRLYSGSNRSFSRIIFFQ